MDDKIIEGTTMLFYKILILLLELKKKKKRMEKVNNLSWIRFAGKMTHLSLSSIYSICKEKHQRCEVINVTQGKIMGWISSR